MKTTDLSSQSMTPPTTAKSKVRFCLKANRIVPILHIKDMDLALIKKLWFTEHELHQTRKEMLSIITSILEGVVYEETDRQTFRGLEYRTPLGADRRQENKYHGLNAVMYEQWRQREMREYNVDYIAEVYYHASYHCQQKAHFLALHDEAVAKKELQRESSQKMELEKADICDVLKTQHANKLPLQRRSQRRRSKIVGFLKRIVVAKRA